MVNVIGVRFQNAGKLYFFDPGPFWPTPGDFVVVETTRGIEFGEVVTGVRELNDERLTTPLKQVVRIATAQDVQHAEDNKRREKEAYSVCQKKIAEHKLDMKLVSVEYTFDNSKILFYFTANGRVDFRSLVKDLAAVFKTRIELRQIGVRDEAKMLGGLGPCGRPICCGAFLGDFQPVSIKMAKEQNLSLNPTKISGVCGRLMCCLKYEQDNYEQVRKRMPKVGKEVTTPDGVGVVWDLNVIRETVRVRIQKGDGSEIKDFPVADVQWAGANRPAPVREAPVNVPAVPAAPDEPEAPLEAATPAEEGAGVRPKPEVPAIDSDAQSRRRATKERSGHGRQQGGEQKPRQDANPPRTDGAKGKNGRLGKPVQRENPNRRTPAEKRAPDQEQGAPAKAQEKGAPKPRPQAQEAASPWKQAVEQALRAARGNEQEEHVQRAPIDLEDHQDTHVIVEEPEEDDTI